MKTRTSKLCHGFTVSFDNDSLTKIERIQNEYLVDRSNVIRILLNNISNVQFGKLLNKQVRKERAKRLIKRKLNFK